MQHLLDFFDRYIHGRWTALRHDDGLRQWSYTADQLRATSEAFARRIQEANLQPGDRLVIWSDSCPEWLAAFWGAMLRGVAVIPLDARASPELVRRIMTVAAPRGIVAGDGVDTALIPSAVRAWRLRDIRWTDVPVNTSRVEPRPDTVAEIVFTSGTTGDPKGVVITHRNIVANITPVERAAVQFGRYLWLLRPLRFLGLLPLSHMFGQALTVFLPPLVGATTVFIKGYSPQEIVSAVRRHRITLAVAVPRLLDLLRDRVRQLAPSSQHLGPAGLPLVRRLWRHRDAHRLFGRKFCGFVVGGAQLDPELEQFWQRLGFAVIQGYGLTETAPIVAWNNPFRISHGTVGMPLEGVDVRIAPDGEVLVRGPSVTSGYLNAPEETRSAFEGGWFHTGDLGSFDEAGRLRIRGRKKDEIVTAEGVHVVPEDVERALEGVSGVREAAVVARTDGGERVHAVLVLEPGTDGAAVIRRANANLESHQRIRGFSVWPGQALPRTEAIRKLKRGEIRRWVAEGGPVETRAMQSGADSLETVLARYAQGQSVSPRTTLDELGLTSLDRIELTMALEDQAGVGLTEAAVARAETVDDLRRAIAEARTAGTIPETFPFPRWTRRVWARAIRDGSQLLCILPLASIFMRRRVEGQVHLSQLRGPVIFAANHQSHFDTPAILSSLPIRWRRHLAVAMAKEFFEPHFAPSSHGTLERVTSAALYYLAVLFFDAFPLPRTGPGTRDTLRYAGELAAAGVSILIFPEGHRTEHGEISAFQPGVGMMASRLRMPVVPIRVEGLDRVLHHRWRWPRRGTVRVSFGPALDLEGDDYAALASRVEHAVRALLTEPAPASRSDAA
ncbi:MAG TPA: AMP-binding protein [Vicinamibacterales bacterium]|nr:AMP-binding protein [Vicinamibacterales bacterium]